MLRHGMSCFVCAVLICAGCGRAPEKTPAAAPEPADGRVRTLADAYLDGYFERNPDQITVYGVPDRRQDGLPDNSLTALKAWQAKEDAWLAQAKAIDAATVSAESLRATYAIVGEALESSIGARVC